MEGYEVVTSDEDKLGHVVGSEGQFLIVEHGALRKTKHAIPKTFAHSDDSDQIVRVTVSKEIVESSPKIENGSLDERAIAEHYGLASGFDAPETEGRGEMLPDDPGLSAEEQALRTGVPTATEERIATRERMENAGDAEIPPSPGLLGGDRVRDAGH
jgi:hypothetical protein